MAKRYTEEIRREAVELYKNGQSTKDICTRFGVARSTLLLWVKQTRPNQNGQVPRDLYLMQKELERLRIENQIFRESECSPASPLSLRLEAIQRLHETYSIHALCRLLQVNRATYYHHTFKSPKQTQLQAEDELLKPLIAEIFQKSSERFGVRRVRAKLLEKGYVVSERRIS